MYLRIKQLLSKLIILFPVILVLLAFAMAVWFIIGIGANDYLENVAVKSVRQQLKRISKEVEFNHGDAIELDNAIKKHFSGESSQPQLLILSEGEEDIYHSSRRNFGDQLVVELKKRFTAGEIKETPEVLSIDGDDYEVAVYTIDINHGENVNLSTSDSGLSTDLSTYPRVLPTGKYYIVYQRVGNASVLLKEMRTYIIYVTFPMIILASLVIICIAHILEKREMALERQQAHERMMLEAAHEKERLAMEAAHEKERLAMETVHEKERLVLQAERERAEEAAKAQAQREKLFRDISHDLRTPLVSIIGYADGIQRGIMKDTETAAAVIVREGKRMNRLLESGLTLSKLDSNAWTINKMTFSLDELMEEQVEALKKLDDKKILKYERTGNAEVDFVMTTDPDLLIRILQNIVSDCMRYAESQVEITLSVGEQVDIMIADDGPGILREDLPHLFEPYYKGKDGKYGIGLSVVAGAARYLGGTVTAKNKEKPGHGAIFNLILPRENPKEVK